MEIALIIMIPITSLLTGYLTLKAYRQGLTHNYELKHDIKPTEPKNPIQAYVDNKAEKKEDEQAKEQANIMNEWLNGKVEE